MDIISGVNDEMSPTAAFAPAVPTIRAIVFFFMDSGLPISVTLGTQKSTVPTIGAIFSMDSGLPISVILGTQKSMSLYTC